MWIKLMNYSPLKKIASIAELPLPTGSDLFSFVRIVEFSQRMDENVMLYYDIISIPLRRLRSYDPGSYSHYSTNRDDKSTL